MGSSMTEPTEGGLGQYFRDVLGMNPRYAGHFSAVLVRQNRLAHRHERNAVWLKVT
jgi:hypothetical protein